MSPKKDYPFDVRLEIQGEILKDCTKLYEGAGVQWITDRTPIDFMAYTLADVQRENVTGKLSDALDAYMGDCYAVLNRHFTTIVALQPGIALVEEEGKAPANVAYIEHLNALVMGLIVDERLESPHFYLQREMTDLEQRAKALQNAITKAATRHKEHMNSLYGRVAIH